MNAKVENQIAKAGLWLVGAFILGLLAAFLGYLLYKGLPVLTPHFIFGKSSDIMAGGETLAVHLWYLLSAGLVPDRDMIADGIGALLIITILVFNFLLVLPLRYFQRHSIGQ